MHNDMAHRGHNHDCRVYCTVGIAGRTIEIKIHVYTCSLPIIVQVVSTIHDVVSRPCVRISFLGCFRRAYYTRVMGDGYHSLQF